MSTNFEAAKVIDRNDLNLLAKLWAFVEGADYIAANATKSVNGDSIHDGASFICSKLT